MTHHPLDGNAIAADQHHGQDRASDFDFCDRCGANFTAQDEHDHPATQHCTMFMFCTDCGDEMEDER